MGKRRSKNRGVKTLNKHQCAAFRPGEVRVGSEEIEELLALSQSQNPEDRFTAASYLCPCHVRRRIDEVWQALYRMLEDDDIKVRRAAWHTLEDGGKPDDPALDAIIDRTLDRESDRQVLHFTQLFAKGRKQRRDVEFAAAAVPEYSERGKCDFCGSTNTGVKKDFKTELSSDEGRCFALVCASCDDSL